MTAARKAVIIAVVISMAGMTVSPQVVASVWGYRAVRAVQFLSTSEDAATVVDTTNSVSAAEQAHVMELVEEALGVLEVKLRFKPLQQVRVFLDGRVRLKGALGYYQLGTLRLDPSIITTDEALAVVVHEMAHLAVDYMAHGNYPTWLTEGIAVLLEKQYSGLEWMELGQEHEWIKIEELDAAFASPSYKKQIAAYRQSYGLVSYLHEKGGQGAIIRLLKDLGRGETIASAVKRTYNVTIAVLEQEAMVSLQARQEALAQGRNVRDEVNTHVD